MKKNTKAHIIIHTTSALNGTIGVGLAQVPGSDSTPIAGAQAAMIMCLSMTHGVKLDSLSGTMLIPISLACNLGRWSSTLVTGWFPGWGNAINATTAVLLTEAVGWWANSILSKASDAENEK